MPRHDYMKRHDEVVWFLYLYVESHEGYAISRMIQEHEISYLNFTSNILIGGFLKIVKILGKFGSESEQKEIQYSLDVNIKDLHSWKIHCVLTLYAKWFRFKCKTDVSLSAQIIMKRLFMNTNIGHYIWKPC